MTLSELGREYAQTARILRERMRQVEAERDAEEEEDLRLLLSHRLRLLRAMYRDTRSVALHLEDYYGKGGSGNAGNIL